MIMYLHLTAGRAAKRRRRTWATVTSEPLLPPPPPAVGEMGWGRERRGFLFDMSESFRWEVGGSAVSDNLYRNRKYLRGRR